MNLKFPRIDNQDVPMLRKSLVGAMPPGLREKADANLAFDVAVRAVNDAQAAAETALSRLNAPDADGLTRAVAMVMFIRMSGIMNEAADGALSNTLARLVSESFMRSRDRADLH